MTPNLPEARVLAGDDSRSRARSSRGPCTRSDPAPWWSPAGIARRPSTCSSTASALTELPGPRHPDGAAHGSGCTHSSTLAARLALGDDLEAAAREAKRVAAEAVRNGLRDVGAGAGPVNVLAIRRQV